MSEGHKFNSTPARLGTHKSPFLLLFVYFQNILLLLSSFSSFLFSRFFLPPFNFILIFHFFFVIVFVLLTPASIVCPSGAWMPFAAPSCRMAFDETPAIVCAKWVTIVYGLYLSLSAIGERGMKGIPNGLLDSDAA